MKKVVFLDRDGILNECQDGTYIRSTDMLKLIPNAAEAIRHLKDHDFYIIVISNQPVIARGWATKKDVEHINDTLNQMIKKESGSKIDKFYFCPHHPNADDIRFRQECECRKPNIGMLTKASKDHNIDLSKCFMVGDMLSDIQLGKNAGTKTLLVKTGNAGKRGVGKIDINIKADHECTDLLEAAKLIANAK